MVIKNELHQQMKKTTLQKPLITSQHINQYHKYLTVHEIFFTLQNYLKSKNKLKDVQDLNFVIFVDTIKGRQIIKMKENQFVFQYKRSVETIYQQIRNSNLFVKNTFILKQFQMEKFIQILIQKKVQLNYLENFISTNLPYFNKKTYPHLKQNVHKMINYFDQFIKKMLIVLQKFELIKKFQVLISSLHNINFKPQKNMFKQQQQTYKIQKDKVQSLMHRKTFSQLIINQNEVQYSNYNLQQIGLTNKAQKQNIEVYRKQIKQLKSKYCQFNVISQHNQSSNKAYTQSTMHTDYQSINDLKFSIQFKANFQNKNTRLSIFQKTKDNQIIFKKINPNICRSSNIKSNTGQDCKKSQQDIIQQKKHRFLQKSSKSLHRLLSSKSGNLIKNKKSNSIFQPNKASVIEQIARKPFKGRSSTAKTRGNPLKLGEQKKYKEKKSLYSKTSQSYKKQKIDVHQQNKKPNNELFNKTNDNFDQQDQQDEKTVNQSYSSTLNKQSFANDLKQIQNQQSHYSTKNSLPRSNSKKTSAITKKLVPDQKDRQKIIQQINQADIDNQNQITQQKINIKTNNLEDSRQSVMSLNKSTKKLNRKVFTKKAIDNMNETDNFQLGSTKRSSLWKQGAKKERDFSRTSFFRTSGYVPRKSVIKAVRSHFNSNILRKSNLNDASKQNIDYLIDNVGLEGPKKKYDKRQQHKVQMKGNKLKVSAFDLRTLSQDITNKAKQDQKQKHLSYMTNLMRSKYDTSIPVNECDQNPRQKLILQKPKMIQTETFYKNKIKLINHEDRTMIDLSKKIARRINALGQKQLSIQRNNYQFSDFYQEFI